MNTQNKIETAPAKDKQGEEIHSISGQSESKQRGKSGKLVANPKTGALGKNSAGFWASRIFKGKNDDGIVLSESDWRKQLKKTTSVNP